MDYKHFELAKKYIVYRYTRALVRKQNTTDESILGLIQKTNKELMDENSNKNAIVASTQRDLIAGEVSKDLTKRILLPEKISKAHEEGVLHFHDADYFLQPIFNCCLINIADMLENGTVINKKMIETPKSFQVACTVTTQIIAAVASSQYGGQSVEVKHLGKYLRRSYEKFKKELVDAYYSMVFNDTFGTAEYVEKDGKLKGIQKYNIIKCRNILRNEYWKEAFIIYNNIEYMNILTSVKGKIRKILGKG